VFAAKVAAAIGTKGNQHQHITNRKDTDTMKSSTKNNAKGTMHQAKGKIKEAAGKTVGNRELEAKGKQEHMAGDFQVKLGKAEKRLKH
jgi:uncharacterized protein YjbJ (UPF0337 family)